jgi:hypothetical protein
MSETVETLANIRLKQLQNTWKHLKHVCSHCKHIQHLDRIRRESFRQALGELWPGAPVSRACSRGSKPVQDLNPSSRTQLQEEESTGWGKRGWHVGSACQRPQPIFRSLSTKQKMTQNGMNLSTQPTWSRNETHTKWMADKITWIRRWSSKQCSIIPLCFLFNNSPLLNTYKSYASLLRSPLQYHSKPNTFRPVL